MKSISSLLILIFACTLQAQNHRLAWTQRFQSEILASNNNEFENSAVAIDENGNTYTVGTRTINTVRTLRVARYDESGAQVWLKEFPNMLSRQIAVSPDSTIIVGGNKLVSSTDTDYIALKLAQDGSTVWERQLVRPGGQGTRFMRVAPNGDVVLSYNFGLARYSADGTFLEMSFTTEVITDLAVDNNSHLFIFTLDYPGQEKYMVRKIAPNGDVAWLVERPFVTVWGVLQVDRQGRVTTGTSADYGPGFSVRMERFSPSGQLLWTTIHPDDNPMNVVTDLQVDHNGHAYLAYPGEDWTSNRFRILKVNSQGEKQWTFRGSDRATWLEIDRHGLVYAGGTVPGAASGSTTWRIYKLHPNLGNVLWIYNYGETNGKSVPLDADINANGEVHIAGTTTETLPVGPGEYTRDVFMSTIKLEQRPEAYADIYSADANVAMQVPASSGVKVNDRYGAQASATVVTPPPAQEFTLHPDGSFTFKPMANTSGDVTFQYKLADPNWASNTTTVTLRVHPNLSAIKIERNNVTGGDASLVTVTLNGPAPVGGTAIALTDNSSVITTPPSVVVAEGETKAITSFQTHPVSSTATRQVIASRAGITRSASITMNPGPSLLNSYTIQPNPVKGGTQATGTVTLTGPAPAGGAVIQLSDNSPSINTPASVTIPAGATQASFPITTPVVSQNATRQMIATLGAVSKVTYLTLTP